MDSLALKFIDERQVLLRESYEKYKQEYPPTQRDSTSTRSVSPRPGRPHNVWNKRNSSTDKRWAWNSWSEEDVNQLVEKLASEDPDILRQLPSNSSEKSFKKVLTAWIKDYMEDTGSCLYNPITQFVLSKIRRLRNVCD
jgi:hypothetical protein